MQSIEFGKWKLLCDPQLTRQAHECIASGGPESCGCRECLNFAAARSRTYPAEVLSLLNRLGIDPRHESEIWHYNRLEPGLHLYGGFFHFAGSIESEVGEPGPFDMAQGDQAPFRLFFVNKRDLLPESFADLPVVQLEFVARVPWVLRESEPE